jgi:hypothetical protein
MARNEWRVLRQSRNIGFGSKGVCDRLRNDGRNFIIFLSFPNHFLDKRFFRVFELSHFQKVSESIKDEFLQMDGRIEDIIWTDSISCCTGGHMSKQFA